jgi:CRISPR/Cas system-associated protein Csx1
MEIALLVFILPLFLMSIFSEEKKDPTPEQKLGEALAKYLEKGVKIRSEDKS